MSLLTAKGREALRIWLAEPSSLPRIQNEAIARMLAGEIGDDESLRASLDGMRAEIAAGGRTWTRERSRLPRSRTAGATST